MPPIRHVDPQAFAAIGAAAAPVFSRDGRTLFHLRGAGTPQVWELDLDSGTARQLTHHDERVAMIRRAPNDDRIVYGIDAGGDERQQLWLLEGEAAAALTEAPNVIHDFGAWSPDGTHLAYAANDRDEAGFDVLVRPLGGEAVQRLYQGKGMLSVAGYRPDGRVLTVLLDRGFGDQVILLLEVIGGGHREVPRDRPTQYQAVRWTPDGTLMALTDAGGRDFLALCRIDPQTGAATPVYEAPGRDVEAWALSPDRALLATVENDRGYAVLRVGPVDGERTAIGGLPRGVAGELSFAADSSRLAFSASSPTEPPSLWVWEAATGAARAVWRPDPYQEAGIPPERFRDFALVEWPSLDERPIPGWLAFPEGERPEGGWPAVIWVHGGPAGQARANFRPDMQMLLAQGYAVLMPNVRGSTGYGRAATESDDRERRHDALQDLVHGWQWLAAHPDIDKRRIGLMGQSYGGWMVLAAITEHPGLWRAAVEYYGIADFTTLLTTTGPWRRDHRAREYGDPARDVELFRRISPIHHVNRVVAPLLVLHGKRDPRVPITESEAFVGAMHDRGQFVKYEVFDYAGHGFIRAEDRRRAWREVAAFFAAHMG